MTIGFRNHLVTRRHFLSSVSVAYGALTCRAQSTNPQQTPAEALAGFSSQSLQMLLAAINDRTFRGQLRPALVADLLRLERKNADDLMLSLLPLARTCARPPLSNFFVGAVVRGSSGSYYIGANIEVPGHALGLTVHAEQASLANAYMTGEGAVSAIAVTAAPCGHCRQFLNEMSPEGDIRVLLKGQAPVKLSALLPMAFGPKDLGFTQGALPIKETGLLLPTRSTDPLVLAALDAARRSYSPYTSSHSGIAVTTSEQRIFVGAYIENAAFNPSLSPLEGALAGLFAARLKASGLTRAILVETAAAKISQESVTRAALSSLAPGARVEILKANP
jgi:cytidine deaminase